MKASFSRRLILRKMLWAIAAMQSIAVFRTANTAQNIGGFPSKSSALQDYSGLCALGDALIKKGLPVQTLTTVSSSPSNLNPREAEAKRLVNLNEQDYAKGRLVTVNGLIISETEASICRGISERQT